MERTLSAAGASQFFDQDAVDGRVFKLEARQVPMDNGSEFAGHALIDLALEARNYFAEPYSSWQRGTNENTNGLIRQYLPKGCDIGAYSDDEIQAIEDMINQRPRKRLDFRTPQHVFDVSFNRGALRS